MNKNKEINDKYFIIKNHPAFSQLGYEIIKKISISLKVVEYSKNAIVYKEKIDKQQFMYIVKCGEFKMTKKLPRDQQHQIKNQIDICILLQGETFGVEHYIDSQDQYYAYTVSCMTMLGELYILNYFNLRSILVNHHYYSPISSILKYQTQLMREQMYNQRQQSLVSLSIEDLQDQHNIEKKYKIKNRSKSTQLTYTDKINLIITGQRSYLNTKCSEDESFDEDKYMHQSIMQNIKAMRTNLNESSELFRRRNSNNDVNQKLAFIKHEDYRSKMKILNHLGYKSKFKPQSHHSRIINFKII